MPIVRRGARKAHPLAIIVSFGTWRAHEAEGMLAAEVTRGGIANDAAGGPDRSGGPQRPFDPVDDRRDCGVRHRVAVELAVDRPDRVRGVLGRLCAFLMVRTRSVYPATLLHAAANAAVATA
jgi:hypothetical protein